MNQLSHVAAHAFRVSGMRSTRSITGRSVKDAWSHPSETMNKVADKLTAFSAINAQQQSTQLEKNIAQGLEEARDEASGCEPYQGSVGESKITEAQMYGQQTRSEANRAAEEARRRAAEEYNKSPGMESYYEGSRDTREVDFKDRVYDKYRGGFR
jgi:hypothetical protein